MIGRVNDIASVATRTAAVGVAAVVMTVGCGGPDSPVPMSGIAGRTVVDAGCPPTLDGQDCPWRPLSAHIVVVRETASGAEQVVGEVDSNDDGMFSIGVPAGSYLVRAQNRTGKPMPSAVPVPVTVHAGQPEVVEVRFDSGVR